MADEKPRILIQLDVDPQPSVFDAVVAVDAGVDHLFRHGGVAPGDVQALVHGALFTRGPGDLRRTAIFVGGSNVALAEQVMAKAVSTFFGPFRVSVLFDANGSNTTAAAAVLAATSGLGGSLSGVKAAVPVATGPVGQRVARLLGRGGADVAVGSRDPAKAAILAESLRGIVGGSFRPFGNADPAATRAAMAGAELIVSAGPAGVQILPASAWRDSKAVRVVVDLNAVPPCGLEGVEPGDKGVDRDGVKTWGALGVGGLKMKIHKRALQALFEADDRVLDAEEVLEIGRGLAI